MTNKLMYFVGNWKMFGHLNSLKIVHQINKFCKKYRKYQKNHKVILCVPDTLIYYISNRIKSKLISIGGQNCHRNNKFGPFTGSVSAGMLKNAGAKYFKHKGIYAFRKQALLDFSNLPMQFIEATEKIECIRYLEYGKKIKMVETNVEGVEIDTPEDLARAKKLWK